MILIAVVVWQGRLLNTCHAQRIEANKWGGGENRTHEKIRVGGVLYVELFCFSPVCEQFVVLPTNDFKLGSHFGGNAYSDSCTLLFSQLLLSSLIRQ